jgi:hypothetical protein
MCIARGGVIYEGQETVSHSPLLMKEIIFLIKNAG